MQVLAGDIGGTKTLLAICDVSPPDVRTGAPSIEVLASSRYESRSYSGVGAICRAFASEVRRPMPRRAGFGVAGPVTNGRSHTTNLPWILDEEELAQALGIDSVRLVNDFHALALGIPAVKAADLVTLNEGVRDPRGAWAVIGAGTGLGEAIATLGASGQREVLASEGGHCSFAPRTGLEIGVLRFLMRRYDHVSWERVLSGDGLVNLADAISHLALKTLATGGVFVAGGIAPKMLDFMKDGRFREAFVSKGRMRPVLEQMPVQIVLDARAGVLGAAALAARESQLAPQTRNTPSTSPE
ncbi:MAG: glucokinase [Deltaproteobacteria bacterium]|nr:MAG: glucokinase [Deltaproteobacteria bacterium]